MRVVHYLNQFFGGRGGEEAAHTAPHIQDGAVGPGRLLEQVLGEEAHVVRTIITGDNYAAENLATLTELVVNEVKASQADLFVAGPCFEAGRYGVPTAAFDVGGISEWLEHDVNGAVAGGRQRLDHAEAVSDELQAPASYVA